MNRLKGLDWSTFPTWDLIKAIAATAGIVGWAYLFFSDWRLGIAVFLILLANNMTRK